jgi:aspartate/methionine/tyrosine aminotransferase
VNRLTTNHNRATPKQRNPREHGNFSFSWPYFRVLTRDPFERNQRGIMTVQPTSSPIFAVANLTSAEQEQLRLVADEEQRSVLYREMRRGRGIRAEDDFSDLSVAENLLTFPSLQPVFDKLKDETDLIRETDMLYFPSYGTNNLRESVAARLTESFQADPPIKPADVFGTAGVASALQAIALGLQLPIDEDTPVPRGSSVLLPAPFWQGFHWSFKQAPNLHRVPVDLGKDFELTVDALQHAYEVTNPKPKLLALTNPHNPLGVNYSKELLESIYTWALEKNRHAYHLR